MSRQLVPTTAGQREEYGLDLNGDGAVDNQFAYVQSAINDKFNVDPQALTERLVDQGGLLQVIDVQVPDPDERAVGAGFALYGGTNPQPPPCDGPDDTLCRRHLLGDGVFDIDPTYPAPPALLCLRRGGQFLAEAGRLSVLVGFFGVPIRLDLFGARVAFDNPDQTLRGIIGGGVTREDIEDKLAPVFQRTAMELVRRDCSNLDQPPACGCTADTAGKTLLGLFDISPKECAISIDEILMNSLTTSVTSPDITVDGIALLSLGFGFEAVPAELAQ